MTTRTEEKGRTIVKTLKHASHRCSYAVVPDIAREGAFDAVGPLRGPWVAARDNSTQEVPPD